MLVVQLIIHLDALMVLAQKVKKLAPFTVDVINLTKIIDVLMVYAMLIKMNVLLMSLKTHLVQKEQKDVKMVFVELLALHSKDAHYLNLSNALMDSVLNYQENVLVIQLAQSVNHSDAVMQDVLKHQKNALEQQKLTYLKIFNLVFHQQQQKLLNLYKQKHHLLNTEN